MAPRLLSLALVLAGCPSENDIRKDDDADTPNTDGAPTPTEPSVTDDPPDPTTETTPTDTGTPPLDTATPTDTGTTTGTTGGLPAPQTPASCPFAPDAAAIADCASGGFAALVGATGYATIQDAIVAAAPNGTATVCPGIWPGPVSVNAPVTLEAADPTPSVTVIDGGGVARCLEVNAAATIRGLTLWQGFDAYGGGGLDAAASGVVLECDTFLDNAAGYAGGGVGASGTLTVRWSTFEANRAQYSGGGIDDYGDVTVEGSVFQDNLAAYEGGALSLVGALVLTDSTFLGNTADYEGGALNTGAFSNDTLTITGSTFSANTAGYGGGAASIGSWGDDVLTMSGCLFEDNSSPNGGGAISFGSWGSITADIADSDFARNSGLDGGAIGFDGWLQNGSALTLSSATFEDGTATGGGGFLGVTSVAGAIAITGTDLFVYRNSGVAGLQLTSTATMDCTTCDFGAGVDDNAPVDADKNGVQTAQLPLDFSL